MLTGPGLDRLGALATTLGAAGGTLMLEAMTQDAQGYPLTTIADCVEVKQSLARAGVPSVGVLLDTFHLTNNGADPAVEMRAHAEHVVHVQVADSPGRGRPGTGRGRFADVLATLDEVGYRGRVACEYQGLLGDDADLLWLDDLTSGTPA